MDVNINPLKLLVVAALAASCSGCAFMNDKVELSYNPRGARDVVPGAERINVEVQVQDNREIKKNLGRKGWAGIVTDQDLAELVKGAIDDELVKRGFRLGSGVSVHVELTKFYNEFKMGFWAGDSIAEIRMKVEVKDESGTRVFSKSIEGSGTEPNIQVAAGHNAKPALDRALGTGVDALFSEPDFIPALIKAAGQTPPN